MIVSLIDPLECSPPHRICHPEKLRWLAERFGRLGWGHGEDALVGYYHGSDLQLLSGTHRHGAALIAGLERIPVVVKDRAAVEAAMGDLDRWREVMRTVPVLGF